MSAFSSYVEGAIADWYDGTTMPAAPGTLYLALFTSDPQDDGSGAEVSGGSYARETLTLTVGTPVVGTGTTISNSANIVFTTATATWGNITHWGVFDAVSGGNLLLHGAWNVAKLIESSDTFAVSSGDWATVIR